MRESIDIHSSHYLNPVNNITDNYLMTSRETFEVPLIPIAFLAA
jgi:hypothetical protein